MLELNDLPTKSNEINFMMTALVTNEKLDGVGPIDNGPSPDKLHLFVKKKKLHVTRDTWHLTHDTRHMTRDMWHMVGGEHSLKISAL